MKKNIACLLVIFVFSSILSAQEIGSKETTSFEQFLLKKGTLFIKEFYKFGEFSTKPFPIVGEAAILTDANTGTKIFALRLTTILLTKYDMEELVGVFDLAEIDSAIKAIKHMIKTRDGNKYTAQYTECEYKGSGDPSFGLFANKDGQKGFFKINYKDTKIFEASMLDNLLVFFESAKAKIIELGGKFN